MTEAKHYMDELPAYSLGVLEQAETLQIEAHLSGCADCSAALQAYLQVVEQLPLAVTLSTPGVEVKSKLLAQVVRSSASLHSAPAPAESSIPKPSAITTGWRARLAGFFEKQYPLRLAGLAVLFLLVVSNLSLWQRLNQLQRPAGFHIVELAGAGSSPDAKGMLVISDEGMEGTLIVEHLPALDSIHQYQLWLIKDGKRTSGGVFSAGESGYGRLEVAAPGSLLLYDSFGVTIEPAGGSPGPTGDKILGGNL